MKSYDFIVIGAGISGASAAYYLSQQGRTAILEREDMPGYHSTGRSAAIFSEHHGPALVCKLGKASYDFLANPPEGFCDHPLLSDRGLLFVGTNEEEEIAEKMCQSAFEGQAPVRRISQSVAQDIVPFIKPEFLESVAYYESAQEIDVAAYHQGFLRAARKQGCDTFTKVDIQDIKKTGDNWIIKTRDEEFSAKVIVNASGAWADEVAKLAGIREIGLQPKRRTVIVTDLPNEYVERLYPMVVFHDQQLYFKTENGQVMISPMDKSDCAPMDAAPDEYDIALAAYLFEERTSIKVKSIKNKWAGLRNFVADTMPVVENVENSGFIWLAGQGGYGIKVAEAVARIVKSLALSEAFPADVAALGVTQEDLSSARLSSGEINAQAQTKVA